MQASNLTKSHQLAKAILMEFRRDQQHGVSTKTTHAPALDFSRFTREDLLELDWALIESAQTAEEAAALMDYLDRLEWSRGAKPTGQA
jgi:hypothetical protein